ncbi:MAG: hypothetical protein ACE5HV_00195 [Acidobacteriota bacterium]
MTRDEAVTEVQRGLGFRTDLATEIITALKTVQSELERRATLPWFLLTEVASASTVKDEERVPVPSDFLREYEEDALHYFNGATGVADEDVWTPLAKDDLEFLRDELPGSGAPQAYALDVKYFRVFPTPDAVYTLKQIYYKTDTVLNSNIENQWLKYAHALLIGEAGIKIASGLRDKEGLPLFQSMAQRGANDLLVENEARAHEGRRYIMGGPD